MKKLNKNIARMVYRTGAYDTKNITTGKIWKKVVCTDAR